MAGERPAKIADIHDVAMSLPEVACEEAGGGRSAYLVRGKRFVCRRGPRPDALDEHGERLIDVLCFWTPDLGAKEALIQDPGSPFFTTPHFDGYRAVLLREAHIGRLTRTELTEVIEEAWLARAPKRLAEARLAQLPR